jgi:hypothetical protein
MSNRFEQGRVWVYSLVSSDSWAGAAFWNAWTTWPKQTEVFGVDAVDKILRTRACRTAGGSLVPWSHSY